MRPSRAPPLSFATPSLSPRLRQQVLDAAYAVRDSAPATTRKGRVLAEQFAEDVTTCFLDSRPRETQNGGALVEQLGHALDALDVLPLFGTGDDPVLLAAWDTRFAEAHRRLGAAFGDASTPLGRIFPNLLQQTLLPADRPVRDALRSMLEGLQAEPRFLGWKLPRSRPPARVGALALAVQGCLLGLDREPRGAPLPERFARLTTLLQKPEHKSTTEFLQRATQVIESAPAAHAGEP